jgi:hypothetical protein
MKLRLRLEVVYSWCDEKVEGEDPQGERGRSGGGPTMRGWIRSRLHGERRDLEGAPLAHPRICSTVS